MKKRDSGSDGAGGSSLTLQVGLIFEASGVGSLESAFSDISSFSRFTGEDGPSSSSSAFRFFEIVEGSREAVSSPAEDSISGEGAALRLKTGAKKPGAPGVRS